MNLWALYLCTYLCILVSECLFQDPKLHTDEAPAEVPQHMDTTLGLYSPGVAVGFFLQNAVPECQSLQKARSNTFLHRLHSNQEADPGEGRRGHVWEGLCRGG